MTITSYDAEKELVSGPVADTVLGRLEGTGVVGLSLAVGPLRRPFAAGGPLLGPEDWKGVTVPGLQLAGPGRHHHGLGRRAGQHRLRLARRGRRRHACAAPSSTSPSTTATG